MNHPFMEDLSSKTVEQLQEKIATITKHLNFAYRSQNSALIHQLNMMLHSYQQVYGQKIDESLNRQNATDKIKVD